MVVPHVGVDQVQPPLSAPFVTALHAAWDDSAVVVTQFPVVAQPPLHVHPAVVQC